VQFDKSGYAALGWSVVSFGLQVAANAEKARKFVFSSLEDITGLMARYSEYENLFRGLHEEFDRLLTNVYEGILLYVIALNKYLQQCGLGLFFERFVLYSNANYFRAPCTRNP
jgi:hypothetical protein